MLGAYVKATGALKVETVQEMIKNMFTGRKAKLVPMNMEALQRGMECIK
jgi:2-oxoglutarate ferredoxin oxidoreductase subunit gamma